MLARVAEFNSSHELLAHYAAVKARRHAAEQAAEMRRRVPVPITAEPLRAHVVTTRPRVCLPALVMDIRPWEALRPAAWAAPVLRRPVTIPRVQRAVCRYFNITAESLVSADRHHPLVRHRQIAMYLVITLCNGASYPRCGRAFHRDHTTALFAVRKITALLRDDAELRATVEAIKAALGVVPEPPVELPTFLPRRGEEG